MANDYLNDLRRLDTPWFYRIAWVGGALLFILSAFLWWNYAMVKPDRVFWGTVSNNLIITGVTKHTQTKEEAGSLDQTQEISLGAQNVVRTSALVKQSPTDAAATTVHTETIGTPQADFARYTKIETNQKTGNNQNYDFGQALNVWSEQKIEEGGNGSFGEALYGIIPVSFIQSNERTKIVNEMKSRNTYSIDYGSLKKRTENGRLIYDYNVKVDPQQYVVALKSIDKASGLNQLQQVDPSQYAGSQPVEVTVSIDARAQQLVSISYPNSARTETYSGYGIFRPVVLPTQTVPQAKLQDTINGILNAE